jgi:membrane-anchored protein YejM (alkaline phosphatase superfamily)
MAGTLAQGKVVTRDETVARILEWLPWVSFFLVSLPLPIVFLVLFFSAASTEAAALYFFLSLLGGAIGLCAALVLVLVVLLYRKRWLRQLRDKLASDGITASEVDRFAPELTSAERKTLLEMKKQPVAR